MSLLLLFVTVVVLAVVGVRRSGFIFRKLGFVLGLIFHMLSVSVSRKEVLIAVGVNYSVV